MKYEKFTPSHKEYKILQYLSSDSSFHSMESTGIHTEQPSFSQNLDTWPPIPEQELLLHAEKENAQESACAYMCRRSEGHMVSADKCSLLLINLSA